MLHKLSEKDFFVLRGPFESGRQSPKSLAGIFLLAIPLQILLFFLTYIVAGDDTIFPNKESIAMVHLIITIVIILLSIMYAIPTVYRKSQKMQYGLSILITTNLFGVFFYLASLFMIGSRRVFLIDEASLLNITSITCIIGILVFIITWIRFMILLKKGAYQEGSKKSKTRGRFESKSLFIPAVVGGTGFSMFLQSAFKHMTSFDGNFMLIITLGPLLFYAMLFILPEQIVLVYCKCRFKSFNFDENGNLFPLGSGDKRKK